MKALTKRTILQAVTACGILAGAVSGNAANQTWTNAPVDASWTNLFNWVSTTNVPGAVNLTGNSVNNDNASFTNPIPGSLIGSVTTPILIDDGARSRQLGGLTFDGNAGAYVFDATTVGTTVLYLSHNNTTRINAAVANPQKFNLAVRTRGPSSTNLRYTLLNDSTNPNATFYFANIAAQGTGATRPLTMVLDGANTGTNTLNNFGEDGTSVGATVIYKQGAGTWVLTGTPQTAWSSQVDVGVTGGVQVVNGILALRDAGVLGTLTGPNIFAATNGTIRLDGVTLNQSSISVVNGGTVRANGSCTLNGLSVANISPSSNNIATTSAGDVFTVGGTGTITGGGANVTLIVGGPGTVVLATANAYAGKWSFNSGTNQITVAGALGTGPNANISAGAILDVTPLGPVAYAPSVAGFGGSGTGTTVGTSAATFTADAGATLDLTNKTVNLTFTPTTFASDTAHPSLYIAQGTLALGNNTFVVNNAGGTALGNGTYRLIQQAAGSVINGGGYAVVMSGSGVVAGSAASISVTGGNVDLVVAPYVPKNLEWAGGTDSLWNVAASSNWLNGVTRSLFNNADNVSFSSVGATNPNVTLVGTLAPTSVKVDTTATNYVLQGAGSIGGSTALTKIGSGTLTILAANSYAGGTIVSNGTLRAGANNVIPSTGSGALTVVGSGIVDLNGFNNVINGLTGDGTVDVQNGGASLLTAGSDNSSTAYSGRFTNSSGTLSFDKVGTGTLTLSGSSAMGGTFSVDSGGVVANHPNAVGGATATLAVNAGSLTLGTSLNVGALNGSGGAIGATGANTLTVNNGGSTSTILGNGTGTLDVFVAGGSLRYNVAETYTGATRLASGTSLLFGNVGNAAGTTITASNATLVSLITGNNPSSTVGAALNTPAGALVTFFGGVQANTFSGPFNGAADSTNVFTGTFSVSATEGFSNYFGTVIISNNASIRPFHGNGGVGGGDNTTWQIDGGLFSRDASTLKLGALTGTVGGIFSPSANANGPATLLIGGKGISTVYSARISGSNNVVKIGAGSLTFDGVDYGTNVVTMPDSSTINVLTNGAKILYVGFTTISNGTLRIVVPNTLSNSPSITLAGAGAVLDVSAMGYVSNLTAVDINSTEVVTNSSFVTNGTLEVIAGQSLNGLGTIQGSVQLDADTTNTVGLSIGTLNVSNAVTISGAVVNMEINRTNSQTADQLSAGGAIAVNGGELNVTNLGPVLQTGDVFHLFNKARVGSGFTTLNLPVSGLDPSNNVVTYVWTNKLAVNGTIEILSGYVPPVTTSSNANLANLVVSPAGALSPSFDSNTLSYTATEVYANGAITITPTAAGVGAAIQVIYGGATNSVASGSPSGSLTLDANPAVPNVAQVLVTAQDATTIKTYTVTVTRQPAVSAPTLARTVSGGNLNFNWPVDHTGWSLQVQTNTRAIGLRTNWFNVAGSTTTNAMVIPVSTTDPTVFYRLFYFAP